MRKTSSLVSLQPIYMKLVLVAQTLLFLGSTPIFASALVPQVGWTLKSVDSEETRGEDGAATNAFDGDVSTFWHTEWWARSPRYPHRIDIDLGSVHDLDGFRCLPRQDGEVNGGVKDYAFYVSLDGVNWGSSVARGAFPNNAQEKGVSFALTQGRYVRFEALSEVNGRPWTSMAELNLLGAAASGANIEPNGVINTPGDGATLEVGGALSFTGSGSDPDSNAALSYRWTFGDPTVADLTVEDPGNVTFNTPGTHTVTLTVVDHLGLADSTPATIQVTVNGPTVSSVIPKTGWTLKSVDSEERAGEDGAATNAFDGNVRTIWHTKWQGSSPRHPHRIDIDLGTVHDLDGFRYLSRQDGEVNGRVKDYAFYVSLDGVNWGSAVASGGFPNNAQEQEVSFALTQSRYIRFEALSEVNGRPWTSMAELNLLGVASSGAPIPPLVNPNDPASVFYHDFNNEALHTYSSDDLKMTWDAATELAANDSMKIVQDPDPSGSHGHVMQAFYAANTIHNNNSSGFSWRTKIGSHDEMYFAYDVYFEDDAEFTRGGKLPGLGIPDYFSAAGVKPDGTDRWTGSLMWAENGAIASYVYHANQSNLYGDNIFWNEGTNGQVYFQKGKWNRVEIYYKMNTPGVLNGRLKGWLNGKLALDTNLPMYRMPGGEHLTIGSISMITMYGGGDTSAPSMDQHIYFDNFVVSTQPITH